jgi:hypothetical protein
VVHRPMDAAWATGLRDTCQAAGVPFFFKQWGGRTPKAGGRLLDGLVWDEMPTRGLVTVYPRRHSSVPQSACAYDSSTASSRSSTAPSSMSAGA